MAFDPDAYLAEENSDGFDPDAYLAEGGPKESPLVSGVRQFVQGGTASFSDEAAGLVEGAGRMAGLEGLGGPMKDISTSDDGPTLDWEILKDAYKRARDKERKSLEKDKKDNPGISLASNLAGAVVSPVNKILPNTSLAKSGAAIGAVTGLGSSDAEGAVDLAKDTATSAALGGALGFGIDKVSPIIQSGIQKISDGAKNTAERLAARSLGAERGTIKKLGQDKVQELGRYALDEKLLSPLASTDDVIARNAAKQAQGGAMMDEVYSAIDDAGKSTFNPLDVAGKVDESIGGFYRSPINRGETSQLENTLESILMRGEGAIPLKEAQVLKQELGKVANWKNNINITDKEKMAREAYGIVSSQIDDAVNAGMKEIGSDGLVKTLSEGKKLFGNSKGAETLLENKLAREQGNNLFGLTDSITGAGALGYGGVTGDWETAGGVMLAKKGLQKYGVQNAALGMDKISSLLSKSPQMAQVMKNNPKVFGTIVHQLESRMSGSQLPRAAEKPEDSTKTLKNTYDKEALLQRTQGTRYGQVLQNAAQKSDQSLSAAHYVLANRDQNYRKTIEGQDGE